MLSPLAAPPLDDALAEAFASDGFAPPDEDAALSGTDPSPVPAPADSPAAVLDFPAPSGPAPPAWLAQPPTASGVTSAVAHIAALAHCFLPRPAMAVLPPAPDWLSLSSAAQCARKIPPMAPNVINLVRRSVPKIRKPDRSGVGAGQREGQKAGRKAGNPGVFVICFAVPEPSAETVKTPAGVE
ncbi:hypothetical protein GCM10009839_51370 [Catenulispora yoronensis]|uniref:Uncharacterized protein n=1 Tax=Catenulispora yoronensis TaxID=450799 RepID=A0ABP5G946_9ACTN